MPAEPIEGVGYLSLDVRSDIYSVGATLFYLLAGLAGAAIAQDSPESPPELVGGSININPVWLMFALWKPRSANTR